MTRRFIASGFLPLRRRAASALLGTIGVALVLLFPVSARGGPLTIPSAPARAAGEQAGPPEANASFGKIPLHFEPNLGQFDPEVQFVARGGSYTAFITADGLTLAAQQGNCGATRERPGQGKGMSPRDHGSEGAEPSRPGPTLESVPCRAEAVKLRIEGRAASARMIPAEPLEGRSSYFLGSDPSKWRTNVPHFAAVRYEGVYPGVDLVLRPTGTNLRYDFEVGPEADPAQIRLAVEGVESTAVEAGVVIHRTASGSRLEHRELKAASGSRAVSAAFELDGAGRIGFQVGSWARKEKLVIDPALVWGTFLGGGPSGMEGGLGLAVDAAGNAYVVGQTGSSDFPTTTGAYDTTYNGFMDVFVAKLNPAGSALLYCTLLGGLGDDRAGGIAVDGAGNAYVTGTTEGEGFPTTAGAYDTVHNGGPDVFVTKLNPTGTGLVYSTFLGGSGYDDGNGIAVDASGSAFVTGDTSSSNFPTTAGAHDATANGYNYPDAFVTKLNPTGTGLVYSTFLGGSSYDYGNGIAVDANGNAFVTGNTSSSSFPTTAGAYDATANGGSDAFVTKLNPTGTGLVYSTFLGGSGSDSGNGIAVDASGNAFVTGYTWGPDFPATPSAFDPTANGGADVFVTKLNPTGAGLVSSTLLGGSSYDFGDGIAVDASGNAFVTGHTDSPTFPTTAGAYDATPNGYYDVFVTKLNPTGTGLVYSTFLGGSSTDDGYGIALDTSGNAFVAGYTYSSNFPTTAGAYDATANGYSDAFVTKLNPTGTGLAYSTFLGGSDSSSASGNGIAVDASGNVFVTGYTGGSNFPTTAGTYDATANGGSEVFVTKLNSTGAGLVYSTFLGGSSTDHGNGIVVDASGNAFVIGYTFSSNFPTTPGAYDATANGGSDAFVAKLNPTGTGLVYSTFLGGSNDDSGNGIAVDAIGNAVMTGKTYSSNFPTTAGAFDTTANGGPDAFVTEVNPTGTGLVYSTFLGGSDDDYGNGIAVDASGNVFLTGYTWGSDFPITSGAYDPTANGYSDAFVTKLSPTGTGLVYSTFLGGSNGDVGNAIAVDASGNVFVTGSTGGSHFPTTVGAYDATFNGGRDAFVTKLNPTGTGLVYSTFVGGSSDDCGSGLAVDASGNAFATGYTGSTNFPTTAGAYDATANGSTDTFVTEVNPTGTGLVYSTFLGGSIDDRGTGIALDSAGSFFVVGSTSSGDFPVTAGAFDTFPDGSASFIVKFGGYDSAPCGTPTAGSLLSTDSRAGHRGSAYYTDFYSVQGSAGQRVTIDLTSAAFDTYLLLVDPAGTVVAQDDNSGGGTNARIASYTLPSAGVWVVEATSWSQLVTGSYVLSIQCDCQTLSIAPQAVAIGPAASSTSVAVNASPYGCTGGSWTTRANDTWLNVTPTSGSGSAVVTVGWTQNSALLSRTGTATIAGETFTVMQSAPPCTSFSISPTSIAPGAAAGSTRLTVTGNPPGCQDGSWSASSNAATWLSVTPSSSTGSGTVTVTWTANNTGAPRSGTASVAGGLFAVNQSAGLAFRTLSPCRLLDTRNTAGPLGGPAIQAAGTDNRQFPLLSAPCGIPADARAIAANVTVVAPAAAGNLLVYPADLHDVPAASSISFSAGRTRAAMSVLTLPSDGSGIVSVRNSAEGTVHLIIDVNGYFAPAP